MNEEEARLYLEHTSKEDFNLEEHQKQNRYEAIQVLLQENKNLKSILTELEEWLKEETKLCDDYFVGECHTDYTDVLDKITELKEKYK